MPVFPCDPANKRPLTPRGFLDATTDLDTVANWWKRWPDAMIGMPTGAASGCWVLDVDDPEAFAASAPALPTTRKAMTGKGFHLYFRDDGAGIRNAQRHPKSGWPFSEMPGAEVRGDGGYVILPPSRHPSGRLYAWAEECDPVAAPAELLRIVTRQERNADKSPTEARTAIPAHRGGTDTPYGLKALESESQAITRAGNGEQECALNEAALKIGALVAGGELSIGTAKARLIGAGLAMPSYNSGDRWTADAIAAKVERALADGAASPRSAPPREYRDSAFAYGEHADRYDPATGELHPMPGAAADDEPDEIETLDWAALATVEPTPKRFVIPNLAPAGEMTKFTGPGSAGKSLFGQQVATAKAMGVPTLGLDMGQAPAIYLTCEDDAEQLHWRQHHICRALGVPMDALAGKLWLASLRGRLDNALGVVQPDGTFTLSPAFHRLGALIRRTGAELVFLDNVSHFFTGNENDRGDVTRFTNALNRMAGETGAAIVLLGHTNKAFNQGNKQGNSHSGSTAWLNAVRSQFTIEHDTETDLRTLTVGKANYARNGTELVFAWQDWAFVLESDLSPDNGKALADNIRANGENAAFMRCLDACTKQRRNVSHQRCANYAPKVFAAMTEAKGIKQKGFEGALERLLHIGKIEADADLWPGANRHPKRGIRAVVEGAE